MVTRRRCPPYAAPRTRRGDPRITERQRVRHQRQPPAPGRHPDLDRPARIAPSGARSGTLRASGTFFRWPVRADVSPPPIPTRSPEWSSSTPQHRRPSRGTPTATTSTPRPPGSRVRTAIDVGSARRHPPVQPLRAGQPPTDVGEQLHANPTPRTPSPPLGPGRRRSAPPLHSPDEVSTADADEPADASTTRAVTAPAPSVLEPPSTFPRNDAVNVSTLDPPHRTRCPVLVEATPPLRCRHPRSRSSSGIVGSTVPGSCVLEPAAPGGRVAHVHFSSPSRPQA
jgi:hypothetical protein